ncbi:MAG: DNA topoisomerase VI subunit B [Deltaproteobacteria bacterium]|nr:DNA topoisomerase VI subunit B [Deltaproteobacteria bacterium]
MSDLEIGDLFAILEKSTDSAPERSDKGEKTVTEVLEKKSRKRTRAEEMGEKQRSISISEFFAKNKQLLGFDSPVRALMTTVKEAVDNSLDACEEAHILPTIMVEIEQLNEERLRVAIQDNGPGIVKAQVPRIFGQLLYGSKFHSLKQSRGQQGIGISAAGMYSQLTTGKTVKITSRIGPEHPAHHFELLLDLQKNKPNVVKDLIVDWEEPHGTRVELEIAGQYKSGRHSVDEYLGQTAVANPHAEIFYINPKMEKMHFPRVSQALPREPKSVKPHPHGIELGLFIKMIRESAAKKVGSFLQHEFSRVTPKIAETICNGAGVDVKKRPTRLSAEEIEMIHKEMGLVKIMAPTSDSIVPIGEILLRRGLARQVSGAEFYVSKSRPPKVYRGNPFIVETAIAYGGELRGNLEHGDMDDLSIAGVYLDPEKTISAALLDLPGFTRKKVTDLCDRCNIGTRTRVKNLEIEELESLRHSYNDFVKKEANSSPAQIIRLANRVPLLYQLKACAISKSVMDINWRRYNINQPKGGYPQGPLIIMVHLASVWVPFTSESKEAVAHFPEIIEEIKLSLQECGRELGNYLSKKVKLRAAQERKDIFVRYSTELARALANITGDDLEEIDGYIKTAMENFTTANYEMEKPALEEDAVSVEKWESDGDDGDDLPEQSNSGTENDEEGEE